MTLLEIVNFLWHKTAVPIYIERFLLAVIAALVVGGLILSNPMGLDNTQRILLILIGILAAYFFAHTLHQYNERNKQVSADKNQQSSESPTTSSPQKTQTIFECKDARVTNGAILVNNVFWDENQLYAKLDTYPKEWHARAFVVDVYLKPNEHSFNQANVKANVEFINENQRKFRTKNAVWLTPSDKTILLGKGDTSALVIGILPATNKLSLYEHNIYSSADSENKPQTELNPKLIAIEGEEFDVNVELIAEFNGEVVAQTLKFKLSLKPEPQIRENKELSQSPQLLQQTFETKAEEKQQERVAEKPNIICLNVQSAMLEESDSGIFNAPANVPIMLEKGALKIDPAPNLLKAIVAEFRNEPAPNQKVLPIKDVQAQIFYYLSENSAVGRVHEGIWLGRKSSLAAFGVGIKQDLILGIIEEKRVIIYDNKRWASGERMSMLYNIPCELIVYVRLFNKKNGEMLKTFKFTVNISDVTEGAASYHFQLRCVGESELPSIKKVESTEQKFIASVNQEKRQYKIERLKELISQYEKLFVNGFAPISEIAKFEMSFNPRVEKFLADYFDDSYVKRFQEKGSEALEDFLKELLD